MDREQQLENRFEALGEEEVRRRVAQGRISGRNADYARAWLEVRDRIREVESQVEYGISDRRSVAAARLVAVSAKRQALEAAEANRLASEANEIARKANEKAATANTIATVAMVMAVISIAVAIIGTFLAAS